MNEETNNTLEEIETTNEVEVCDEPEENSGSSIGLIVAGAVALIAGAAFVLHKTKAKREEYLIKKLEKKGYTIYKTDVVYDESEVSESEDNE